MSKLGEAGFRGVAGAATGAGIGWAIAGLAFPIVAPVLGAIAAVTALILGGVFEEPDAPLIEAGTQQEQSAL